MPIDNALWEKLYRTHYMRIYSYLVSLSSDPVLSEELTQETFFRAFTTKADFRGDSDVETWLCAIAKRLFIDEMRKRNREGELDEEADSGIDLASATADKDLSLRIHRILHTMREPWREVFELRVFGELSFSEIGTIFGKTESWARVTYHRAKLFIQERMV